MKGLNLSLVALLVLVPGCMTPPPKPKTGLENPENGLIGITVSATPPIGIFANYQDVVAFVRVDEDGDILAGENWFQSTYEAGDQIFLLNAEPGEYVAVASVFQRPPDYHFDQETQEYAYLTYLDEEAIRLTRVRVLPGEAVFMGKYEIRQHTDFDEADRAQRHYAAFLDPFRKRVSTAKELAISQMFLGKVDHITYRGTLEEYCKDDVAAEEFFTEALEYFRGTDWQPMIETRLKELRGPCLGVEQRE